MLFPTVKRLGNFYRLYHISPQRKGKPIVFLLWGRPAREKQTLITNKTIMFLPLRIQAPFGLERFFGCRHFSKTNKILTANGMQPIDWQL